MAQTSEARIETEQPGRLLVRFCTHAASMGGERRHRLPMHSGEPPAAAEQVQVHAEWSEAQGTVRFDPWGSCSMAANGKLLTVRIEAADEAKLRRIQGIVTADLSRFAIRQRLDLDWRRPPEAGSSTRGGIEG